MAEGGLHPRAHRRRDVPDRGSSRARQEVQARHRGGGRPDRGERRHPDAARRQLRAGAEARRGAGLLRPRRRRRAGPRGRGRSRRRDEGRGAAGQPHRVQREVRLPGLRLHHRGGRAAAILVQRTAGRVPGVRRAGRKAAVRSAAGRAERAPDAEAGRGRAVGEIQPAVALLHAGAVQPREGIRLRPHHPVGRAGRGEPGRHPVRHQGQGRPAHLQGRAQGIHRAQGVRGRHRQPQPPDAADRERVDARGAGQVPDRAGRARRATASASTKRRWR